MKYLEQPYYHTNDDYNIQDGLYVALHRNVAVNEVQYNACYNQGYYNAY